MRFWKKVIFKQSIALCKLLFFCSASTFWTYMYSDNELQVEAVPTETLWTLLSGPNQDED